MEKVRWKFSSLFLELPDCRLLRFRPGIHAAFVRHIASLQEVAVMTGCDDIVPGCPTTARSRDHMIERQIVRSVRPATILALPVIAQKHIKPCKGRLSCRGDKFFQRQHARQFHFLCRGTHDAFVFRDDYYRLTKNGLHSFLPRPYRQREIRQRSKIRIEDQCGALIERPYTHTTRTDTLHHVHTPSATRWLRGRPPWKALPVWPMPLIWRGSRGAPFIIILYLNSGLRYTFLVNISLLHRINYVKYFFI